MTLLPPIRFSPRVFGHAALGLACAVLFGAADARGQGSPFIYRDVNTGIVSNSNQPSALRFMRHIWITSDDVMATAMQKGGFGGDGLVLYKSLNEGGVWTPEMELDDNPNVFSDGILDADNNLLLVTSFIGGSNTSDVEFIKLIYNPVSPSWTVDPSTPVTVLKSHPLRKLSRASISLDSAGVLWCAFRAQFLFNGIPNLTQIKVFYSADGGHTWTDSNQRFGELNRLEQKTGKLLSVGTRTVLVYQDLHIVQPDTLRFKSWAYRDDSAPLGSAWIDTTISQMVSATDDTLGSHFSVATDGDNNIHLSYQDAGIRYLKYDAATAGWKEPLVLSSFDGSYNSISVAANNNLYVFSRFSGALKVFCKQYSVASQQWSRWLAMSAEPHLGYLRMSSPDRFVERLPMLYEVDPIEPHTLLYVLFDTYYAAQCR